VMSPNTCREDERLVAWDSSAISLTSLVGGMRVAQS
jgi:hypothetical protein